MNLQDPFMLTFRLPVTVLCKFVNFYFYMLNKKNYQLY